MLVCTYLPNRKYFVGTLVGKGEIFVYKKLTMQQNKINVLETSHLTEGLIGI